MENKKICIILGTRPEIIKLSQIIRICEFSKIDYFVIHTNQHYSENMDKVFFSNLDLPSPRYNLNIGSFTQGKQTGIMLEKIEEILMKEIPEFVIVQGDTNSVLAGALAASKLNIKVCHVEAGLRSYDNNMPEEKNRIITDHISDYLFVPTQIQKEIIIKEGINPKKIFIVGNTIVDAVYYNKEIALKNSKIKQKLNLENEKFILVTSHRQENVDNENVLKNILNGLDKVNRETNLRIIYPIHPRTKKNLEKFKIKIPENIEIIEPLDYFDFLWCEINAKLIITDSGGVQEEACILKTPCVTIRNNTERPETVNVGANIIVGTNSEDIVKGVKKMIHIKKDWEIPFGDGNSSKKIINNILNSNY